MEIVRFKFYLKKKDQEKLQILLPSFHARVLEKLSMNLLPKH